ncbi:MAG: hypothetical protein E7374_01040 [Clostridiales bacterium]|nr:hypothetical protein [Clostridiales bacterium]
MIEQIAMWGGFAGIIVALISITALIFIKKSIVDIVDRDLIFFDKNFELKKEAIESSLHILDKLNKDGYIVKNDPKFVDEANACYNQLLCVVTDIKLAENFYSMVFERDDIPTELEIAKFKLSARKDIGLSVKGSKAVKHVVKNVKPTNFETEKKVEEKKEPSTRYEEPTPEVGVKVNHTPIPEKKFEQVEVSEKKSEIERKPLATQRPIARPTTQARPINEPTQAVRPMARTTRPTSQTTSIQPIKRSVGRPKKQ